MMDELDQIRQDFRDQKYVESFQVGQRIRSYDFPHNRDAYVEGIIREIGPWEHCEFQCGHPHLHIEVTLDTFPEVSKLQDQEGDSVIIQVEGDMFDPEAQVIESYQVMPRAWFYPVIPTSRLKTFSTREMLEVLS